MRFNQIALSFRGRQSRPTPEFAKEKDALRQLVERITKDEAEYLYRRDWWKFPLWDLRDWFNKMMLKIRRRKGNKADVN